MEKAEIKKKKNMKESINEFIDATGIVLGSDNEQVRKTDSYYSKTGQYWEDLYHLTQNGSIIDTIVKLSRVGEYEYKGEYKDLLEEQELWKSNETALRELIVKGRLSVLYYRSESEEELGYRILNSDNVKGCMNNINGNEAEFYTVEYKGIVDGAEKYWHYKSWEYWRLGKEVERKLDDKQREVRLEENGVIRCWDINKLVSDTRGYSLMMRMNEFIDAPEEYLKDTKKIMKQYRSSFLDISVPLSGESGENGVDKSIETAGKRYKGMEIGSNVVHGPDEKWEVKEYPNKQVDPEVRRGFVLYMAAVYGGGEIIFGDASNVNYSTAQTQLIMYRGILKGYQKDIISMDKGIVYYYEREVKGKEKYRMSEVEITMPEPLADIEVRTAGGG